MPDYRIYRRRSTEGFDGTTPETASYDPNRYLYTTEASGVVGLFGSSVIGRSNVASLVTCTIDGASPGDSYAVVSPEGSVRETAPLAAADTEPLLLHPGDSLAVTSATGRNLDVIVNDLDDGQFFQWLSDREGSCCKPPTVAVFEVTATENGELPAPTAELNFYLCSDNDNALFSVSDPGDWTHEQQLFIANLSDGLTVGVQAPTGVTINGVDNGFTFASLAKGDGVALRKVTDTRIFGTRVA